MPNLTKVGVIDGQVKEVQVVPVAGGNQKVFVNFTTEVGIPNRILHE